MIIVGVLSCMTASIIWAGCFGAFRHHGQGLSAFTLNLLKTSVGVLGTLLLIAVTGRSVPQLSLDLGWLVASGMIGLAIGDLALLGSLKRLTVRSASMLFCLSPVFAIAIGYGFLGETLSFTEALGSALTLLSVFAVLYLDRGSESKGDRATQSHFLSGVLLGLLSALLNALGIVLARKGLRGMDSYIGAGIRLVSGLVAILVIGAAGARTRTAVNELRGTSKFRLLFMVSFMGTFIGIILATVGTKFLKAGLSATLLSSVPVWAVLWGHYVFHERARVAVLLWTAVSLFGISMLFF